MLSDAESWVRRGDDIRRTSGLLFWFDSPVGWLAGGFLSSRPNVLRPPHVGPSDCRFCFFFFVLSPQVTVRPGERICADQPIQGMDL